jgi:hypothetical protein
MPKKCDPPKKGPVLNERIDALLAQIDQALEENEKALGDPPRQQRSRGKRLGTTQPARRFLSS